MARYDSYSKSDRISKLTLVAASQIDLIRSRYHWLPDDYLEFLRDVGAGEIGDSSFMIYDSPVPGESIFGNTAVPGVLAVGDDFQGYVFGYSRATGTNVVEIDPSGATLDVAAPSFAEFIRGWLVDS